MSALKLFGTVVLLAAGCGGSAEPPAAPAEVAIGKTKCSSCAMGVDDARFAAQCRTKDGALRVYDDLGCMVIELGMGRLEAHDVYFHHFEQDRWVPVSEVGFKRYPLTPMQFGYVAVDRAAGELSFEQVRAEMKPKFELKH